MLESPRTLVVGGEWNVEGGRPSKVIVALADELAADVANGGHIDDLPKNVSGYDLSVWMPNISNGEEKRYPKKDQGSVLVCSKVKRVGGTKADAVTRIFAVRGNAVIQIRYRLAGKYEFCLLDALGNCWVDPTDDTAALAQAIMELYRWTKGSLRVRSVRADAPTDDLNRLMACTRCVADRVENSLGERYFGNTSTRCQRMFPGAKTEHSVLISPRNTDKRRLEAEDMISVSGDPGEIRFLGPRKPSVDAPIQVYLFLKLPEVNFFIHGHAKVVGAPATENYFPCGDMREAVEVYQAISRSNTTSGAINLKNHGFLLHSQTIEEMEELVSLLEFEAPN